MTETEQRTPILRWSRHDDHWPVSLLALAGLVLAVLMARVGLPPFDLHGVLHRFGIMDPLCGGTRAVRYATRGQWAQSWRYNPLGIPLVVGAVLVLARAALGTATGRWLNGRLPRRARRPLLMIALVALVALQVRQQMLADLLIAR